MGEPGPDGQQTPPLPSRCFHCGTELAPEARFCAKCERYQPDPPGTPEAARNVVPCRFCSELIPAGANRCNRCELFQSGFRRWVPASAATVSALGALASLLVLLFSTLIGYEGPDRSQTDLDLFGHDSTHIFARVANDGTKASFVGRAWFKLAKQCDWMEHEPAFCTDPAVELPKGVLELRADPRKDALIRPGHSVVEFQRIGDFSRSELPQGLTCSKFATEIQSFRICLAFEVVEYREPARACLRREVATISERSYLSFVSKAACGK